MYTIYFITFNDNKLLINISGIIPEFTSSKVVMIIDPISYMNMLLHDGTVYDDRL